VGIGIQTPTLFGKGKADYWENIKETLTYVKRRTLYYEFTVSGRLAHFL
jgi:hypothetical protein